MKREDLEKLGLTKEQVDSVCDLNNADVQPLKTDLQKAQDDLKGSQEKVTITETALKKLEGVDAEALNKQITDLKEDLKLKDSTHAAELSDRDFNGILKDSILSAKGKDAEKIIKLLDTESLKVSKNQKEDIVAAIKTMAEDEVTKGMFGETEPNPIGTGNLIGQVQKSSGTTEDAVMRAAMGLPPVTTEQK